MRASVEFLLHRKQYRSHAVITLVNVLTNEERKKVFNTMGEEERRDYEELRTEEAQQSFLMGRWAAKVATAHFLRKKGYPLSMEEIRIQRGVFWQPLLQSPVREAHISISHSYPLGAAIAFPEAHPMGIDLEQVGRVENSVIQSQMTKEEVALIQQRVKDPTVALTFLWVAKEALSKVLKTGLMTPMVLYEIGGMEVEQQGLTVYYKNFPQYKGMVWYRKGWALCITLPRKTEVKADPWDWQGQLAHFFSNTEGNG